MDDYTQWTLQGSGVTDEQIQAAWDEVACMERRAAENEIFWEGE